MTRKSDKKQWQAPELTQIKIQVSRTEALVWIIHASLMNEGVSEPVLDHWRKHRSIWFCLRQAPGVFRASWSLTKADWYERVRNGEKIGKLPRIGVCWAFALGKVIRLLFGPRDWFRTRKYTQLEQIQKIRPPEPPSGRSASGLMP